MSTNKLFKPLEIIHFLVGIELGIQLSFGAKFTSSHSVHK